MTKEKIIKKLNYELSMLSDKTKHEYIRLTHEIIDTKGKPSFNSKSKYLQLKAVMKRINKITNLNYTLPNWTKKEHNTRLNKIRQRLLKKEDIEKILHTIPDTPKGNQLRLAVKISFYSGLRVSEVLSLKPEDIVFGKKIYINVLGKGGKFRKTPCISSLKSELQNFTGFTIGNVYARLTFEKSANKALNKHVTFHCLRHSFTTEMLKAGLPTFIVMRWLGHNDIRSTQVYAHLVDDDDYFLDKINY